MSGVLLIIIGIVIMILAVILFVLSVLYRKTAGKRIREELKEEYDIG